MKALILSLLLISSSVMADETQELIHRCEEALRGESHWNWSVVRVRVILELGISVPLLSSFHVEPEVELYFTKK